MLIGKCLIVIYMYRNGIILYFKNSKNFFRCGSFLESLLNLLQYCFCFMFWVWGLEASGILTPRPGIKPAIPALEKSYGVHFA